MTAFTTSSLSARLLRWTSLSLCLAPLCALGAVPTVEIDGTSIFGASQPSASNVTIEFFGGIPFAEPPLGRLRFAPPVATDSFAAPRLNATTFGASCVQLGVDSVSEDCLTLNIFRPSESVLSNESLVPVMVWFYGGGFRKGTSSSFNASEIIAQSVLRGTPVVYVSFNYRVGPFGFPQGTEAGELGAVNLGLEDQLAAVSWVHKHIGAFGGDPTKITLFGQSAGSVSIADLYLNSGLENFGVRGAIMESGAAETVPLFNASRRDLIWDTFATNVTGCEDVAQGSTFSCLRNATTSALVSSWEAVATTFSDLVLFGPVLDGPTGLLPDLPSKLLATGRFSKIPFITGTVLDEGTAFVPQPLPSPFDPTVFLLASASPSPHQSSTQLEEDIETLLGLYPDDPTAGSPFGTGNETFGLGSEYKRMAALVGDVMTQAPKRAWIQAAAKAGVAAYGYMFADKTAAEAKPSLGVYHGTEIPWVYGLPSVEEASAESGVVSRAMVDYWLSFVVSGTPNDGKGLARTIWPQYKSDNQVLIQFDTTNLTSDLSDATFATIPDDYRAEQMAFIDSIAADLNE
ncbi:hypothetical protein GSI_11607 [Ganoderma sinense ZZ0214-1]|uniref:Carboxylic ester hydrolase n=1 Tax=Ganoderma sinense ZZ0214-1 TaxID=1077348 RepID=A0A2G8RWJ5_9APHY|nr:hypothetical protein GSI_11607 [Ganoderma sinense ZZ0214-1]